MTSFVMNFVLQTVECLVCFSFYESITKLGKGMLKRFLAIFVLYIIMYGVNIVFDYNIVVNTVAMVAFHIMLTLVVYKQKFVFSFVYSALITSLVTITEFSAITIASIIFKSEIMDFTDNMLSYVVVIVLSKSLLFTVLRIIGSVINRFRQNEKINPVFLAYPFSLLVVLTAVGLIAAEFEFNETLKLILSVSVIVLTFSVILTCIFQQRLSQTEQELFELKAITQKNEMDNTYLEILERQNEELQLYVHDTKKHMGNIYGIADDADKTREYIQGMLEELDGMNRIGKTNNKLLDLIVAKYDYLCEKYQINFEKNIHYTKLDFLADNDITAIFNNLLDNAVEAAAQSQEKYINLSINCFDDMLHIIIENISDFAPVTENRKLVTTKPQRRLHGLGFKSVMRSVKKYKGDVFWDFDKDQKLFTVSIIFSGISKLSPSTEQ
ncbi:MAG: GHKL domain-containing protein [Clostridia bacterium]|nr:GHKL domain-containing protein [Clostridia bacterium]